jgi:glycosyltransferase involved in cell wall biosynthesis
MSTAAADGVAGFGPPESLRVSALATFPVEAAATRFRIAHFVRPLSDHGIEVTIFPFLSASDFSTLYDRSRAVRTTFRLLLASVRRLFLLPRILRSDVLLVQREAMLFGPPWIEWFASRVMGIPLVLDLDDPTWIPTTSPVYGRLATWLKWPSKTDRLIRWAHTVICGNETIASHVRAAGTAAVVMQTIVDTDIFVPRADAAASNDLPVVGWIGTHSTWSFVESILPVLEDLAKTARFRVRVVGSGRANVGARDVDIELLPWQLDREVLDFQTLDVGIYPMPEDEWTIGKSGLKLVEYFACGVACVVSPVGVVREIGVPGVTHLEAATLDEWRRALERLLFNAAERRAMAAAARRYAVDHYSVAGFSARIAAVLREAAPPQRGVDLESRRV